MSIFSTLKEKAVALLNQPILQIYALYAAGRENIQAVNKLTRSQITSILNSKLILSSKENLHFLFNHPDYLVWLLGSYYTNIEGLRKAELSRLIKETHELIEDTITKQETFSPEYIAYFKSRRSEGVPYVHFDTQPYQVSLVKKIINSLYYGEKSAIIFEANKVPNWKALFLITSKLNTLVNEGYESMNTGTRAGADLLFLIKPHIDKLKAHFIDFLSQLPANEDLVQFKISDLEKALKVNPNASKPQKTGQLLGVLTEQANPKGPSEKSVIADVATSFPKLFKEARTQLEKIRTKAYQIAPELKGKDYQALELEGERLLQAFQSIDFKMLYHPQHLARFYDLIRQLLNLYNETSYQLNELNSTSSKFAKEFLYKFKKSCFLPIVAMVDKLESACLQNPGLISEPTLRNAHEYYQALLNNLYFIDFEQDPEGCRVKELIDEEFTSFRIKEIQKNIDESELNEMMLTNVVKTASKNFFKLLHKHQHTHLVYLPLEVKKALFHDYQLLRPYVYDLDEYLDAAVMNCLKETDEKRPFSMRESVTVQLSKASHFVSYMRGGAPNLVLLSHEKTLIKKIIQHEKTLQFQKKLDEILINNARKQSKHYAEMASNKLMRNVLFKVEPSEKQFQEPNLKDLNTAKDFFEAELKFLKEKKSVENALVNFKGFIEKLKEITGMEMSGFSLENKEELRSFYIHFQPYLLSFLGEKGRGIDKQLRFILNPKFKQGTATNLFHAFQKLDKSILLLEVEQKSMFLMRVEERIEHLKKRASNFHAFGLSHTQDNNVINDLSIYSVEEKKRVLTKAKELSGLISEIQKGLDFYLSNLDENVAKLLVLKKPDGVPYPEMDDEYTFQETPAQILAIKRLRNVVHYLKTAIEELSKLDNKSYKTFYVIQMLKAVYYIYCTYKNSQDFIHDPYLEELEENLFKIIHDAQTSLPFMGPTEPESIPLKERRNDVANDPLQNISPFIEFLYQGPVIIKHKANGLICPKPEKQKQIDKADKLNQRIKNIFDKSNSWVALLWSTPEIIKILMTIKNRCGKLSAVSYEAVIQNLKTIKAQTYVQVLSSCQKMELTLCLKKGAVAKDSMQILDEMFEAFFEQLSITDNDKFYLNRDIQYIIELESELEKNNAKENLRQLNIAKKQQTIRSIIDDINIIKSNHLINSIYQYDDKETVKDRIIDNYKKVMSLFNGKQKFNNLSENDFKQMFSCNNDIFDEFETFCISINKILISKSATVALTQSLFYGQEQWLKKLKHQKAEALEIDIKKFAAVRFDALLKDRMNLESDWSNNLLYLKSKYQADLFIYVHDHKDDILDMVRKTPTKIDANIRAQINSYKEKFDSEPRMKVYLSLDKIYETVICYELYLYQKSASSHDFEGMTSKMATLKKIKDTISHSDSPIAAFSYLREFMQQKETYDSLKATMQHTPLSWAWFVNWYDYVLSCLGLSKTMDEQFQHALSEQLLLT